MRYTGTPRVWQPILAGGAGGLVVTPTQLFAVSSANGDLLRYDTDRAAIMRRTGTPMQWQQIGGAASRISAGGTHLYLENTSGDAVFMYGN